MVMMVVVIVMVVVMVVVVVVMVLSLKMISPAGARSVRFAPEASKRSPAWCSPIFLPGAFNLLLTILASSFSTNPLSF